MSKSALKIGLWIVNSALRNYHVLFHALILRIQPLSVFSVECIKCIKSQYNISILYIYGVWFQEVMHFLHERLQHSGISLKPNALSMHLAVHRNLASRCRIVHEVYHFLALNRHLGRSEDR